MPAETASPSRIKISWLFWTLAAFAIFALIAGYSSRMTHDYPGYDQGRADARYATLAKLRSDTQKTLTTADWVDQDKGTIRIPIQEAMVKEVDTLKGKPAAMGAVIPGSTPPAAANPPAEAGGTTVAPGAAQAAPPTAPGPAEAPSAATSAKPSN